MGDDASVQAMLRRAQAIAPGDVDARYPTMWS